MTFQAAPDGSHDPPTDDPSTERDAMEQTARDLAATARRRCAPWAAAVAMVLVAGVAAACGSGSSTTTTTTGSATTAAIVQPPPLTLQGCNYVINGVVPPGMSTGMQPPFPKFAADQAAVSALQHIKDHGGKALVDGFVIPAGTKLYAGPDASGAPVATIAHPGSLLIAEPVLWTTGSGRRWLATFLACGGPNLYWIDVSQTALADKAAGTQIADSVAAALAATPTASGISAQPITIDAQHHFAWSTTLVHFAIGRGIYQGF